jgi:hypothetical protein
MPTSWPPMERRGCEIAIANVLRFEQEIKVRLPDDYRRFLLEVNGGRTANTRCRFTMRRGEQIGKATLNTLHSLDDQSDDGFDLREQQLFRRYDYPENGLRIGYASGWALVLILSGPHRGELWILAIQDPPIEADQRVEWFDRPDAWKVADGFAEFMAGLRPSDAGA